MATITAAAATATASADVVFINEIENKKVFQLSNRDCTRLTLS